MQKKQKHLAIIINHNAKAVGIITIEDVLESLLGQMQDEFKNPLYNIDRQQNGLFVIGGLVTVGHLQQRFHLFPKEEAYDTVEGMMYEYLDNHPMVGSTFKSGKYVLRVAGMNGKRVTSVHISES